MATVKYLTTSVPYFEHPQIVSTPRFNWDDVRVFLALARRGSFRLAARDLGVAVNTVRRHLERLEHQTAAVLAAAHPTGVELTREGRELLVMAQQMEIAANDIERISGRAAKDSGGRVRVSVTEGLGTFWLMPRLVRFQRAHPNILVEASCTFREPDVAKLEADLAIQLTTSRNADLKTVRLGHMHVMPFASPDYLRTYGTPKNIQDVASHKIVEQLSPQLDVTAVDRLFPNKAREGFVSVATNTSTAHFWAVVKGAGIGMLPTYLMPLGTRLVPVDLDLVIRHEIWLSYHPDVKRLKRVSLMITWLRENFDPVRFPWFREDFVHPTTLLTSDPALVAENHFASLLTVG